jgi:hypothetical protein
VYNNLKINESMKPQQQGKNKKHWMNPQAHCECGDEGGSTRISCEQPKRLSEVASAGP